MAMFHRLTNQFQQLRFVAVIMALLASAALFSSCAQAAVGAGEVPAFKIRARILEADGKKPAAEKTFKLGMEGTTTIVEWKGEEWSPWFSSTPEQITVIVGAWYNATNNDAWQVVAKAGISGGVETTRMEVETEINGETSKTEAHLSRKGADPSHLFLAGGGWNRGMAGLPDNSILGFLIWKGDDAKIHMDTLAGHGRRVYGPAMDAAKLPENERPKQIIFADGMRYADDDLLFIQQGLERLRGLGFNAAYPVTVNLNAAIRDAGFSKIAGGTYMPPGYVWNFKPDAERQKDIKDFVDSQLDPVLALGWKQNEIAYWSTSDEPSWHYPNAYTEFNANPIALAAFHAYLQKQNLKPADFGKANWDEVKFIGRPEYSLDNLPSRRLFYWSNRFVPNASSRYFAEITIGYEAKTRAGFPVLTNFNTFSGRMYTPQPGQAVYAVGSHDWLEFGRERAATAMGTEDWIDDPYAYHLSYHASRLWSASQENGSGFGFLVVPRTGGQRPFGMAHKILSVVGHGGKLVHSFTFGPEYTFPINCYSEKPEVFKPLATAMGIVAKGEDLLYPGKLRAPQVAILTPQSAQFWDLETPGQPGIQEGTNINLMANHMAYSSEVFGLWRALNDTGTPVGFVDERHLAENDLKNFKVLYITEPDLPRESMDGVLQWVRDGGTLVMTAGAGLYDRYHQPDTTLMKASGLGLDGPLRAHVSEVRGGEFKVEAEGSGEAMPVYGPRETITVKGARVLRTFTDGLPAVTDMQVGKGRIQRIAAYGGIIYFLSNNARVDQMPTGFNPGWRDLITQPVRDAKVELPVTLNQPVIEAPALYSEKGVAVTLLNWSGVEKETQLVVKTDKPVKKVESVQKGAIEFKQGAGQIAFRLPVGDVDVVKIYYAP